MVHTLEKLRARGDSYIDLDKLLQGTEDYEIRTDGVFPGKWRLTMATRQGYRMGYLRCLDQHSKFLREV